ncbi:MAG: DUF192 domain-containing protein [Paracoccaceae bacterium]
MTRRRLAAAAAALVSTLAAAPVGAWAGCTADALDLRGDWGQARFSVEIADDAVERGRGLMFRESMPAMAGMLFVYERPQRASFWMKNTLIPLDMIFFDETGTVTRVHDHAVPGDLTPIDGGEGVALVLELNAGMAARLKIAPGSQLRHPAVDPAKAAWPCD